MVLHLHVTFAVKKEGVNYPVENCRENGHFDDVTGVCTIEKDIPLSFPEGSSDMKSCSVVGGTMEGVFALFYNFDS